MTPDLESLMKAIAEERAEIKRSRDEESAPWEFFEPGWKVLCGEKLHDLMASRASAEKYLRDPSWKLRLAAITIVGQRWGADQQFAELCEKLAFEDEHEEVRAVALSELADCYRGTNDRRVGTLLARIVRDPTRPEGFRESAYQGLFRLRGVPVRHRPIPGKYRIPEDVDWVFVDSFLDDPVDRFSGETVTP